jgi:hypothetical protein
MSWAKSPVLLMLAQVFVGLGSGTTFLAALTTAIALQNTVALALVSFSMSFSIATTIYMTNAYEAVTDCTSDHCWRQYVRLYGVVAFIACAIGSIGVLMYERDVKRAQAARTQDADIQNSNSAPYLLTMDKSVSGSSFDDSDDGGDDQKEQQQQQQQNDDGDACAAADDERGEMMSCRDGLKMFGSYVFWIVFIANLFSSGAGIFVVTLAKQLWEDFLAHTTPHGGDEGWSDNISISFSYVTAASNILSPLLADYLQRRRIMQTKSYMSMIAGIVGVLFVIMASMNNMSNVSEAVKLIYICLLASVGVSFGTALGT